MDYLPPRWIRRLIIAPVVFVGALILTVASPAIHLVAAVIDLLFDRKRWRVSRAVGMGLAFCVAEVFGLFALFTVWVGSGFGFFMHRPFWVKANNLLTGQYMELVTNAIAFFAGFEFRLTFDADPVGAQLLFTRHVGPGDVFRLMKIVFRDMGRRCHAVGAAKLQWDPFLDISGERLGFHYLLQSPNDTTTDIDRIRRLAAGMGDDETLILCPEGGNYTPKRRERRIELERALGREHRAEMAESLKHTLLPKTGGVMAAIEGAPDATVVFLGHAGLDDVHGFRSLWRLMPLNRTVIAHGWTVSLTDLPADRVGRSQWLLEQWRQVDDWIDVTLSAEARQPQPSASTVTQAEEVPAALDDARQALRKLAGRVQNGRWAVATAKFARRD